MKRKANRRKPWSSKKCGLTDRDRALSAADTGGSIEMSGEMSGIVCFRRRIPRSWKLCPQLHADHEYPNCKHVCVSAGHHIGLGRSPLRYQCPNRMDVYGRMPWSIWRPIKEAEHYVWGTIKEQVIRSSESQPSLPPISEEDGRLQ